MKKRVIEIEKEMKSLEQELKDIQSKCRHRYVHKKAEANTGNYCPNDDHYWYVYSCPTCGKRWREDQ